MFFHFTVNKYYFNENYCLHLFVKTKASQQTKQQTNIKKTKQSLKKNYDKGCACFYFTFHYIYTRMHKRQWICS